MKQIRSVFAALAVCFAALATASAQAEASARTFLEEIDGEDRGAAAVYEQILHAYGIGMAWARAGYDAKGAAPLYCVPENLALTAEQEVEMVRQVLKTHPNLADERAGAVLLMAYRYAFPCDPDR